MKRRVIAGCALALAALLASATPVSARILKTRKSSQSQALELTARLALEAELATASGGVRGQAGTIGGVGSGTGGGSGRETEATIGLAENITHRVKVEEGVVVKADGGWQVVFAWEFDFGESR